MMVSNLNIIYKKGIECSNVCRIGVRIMYKVDIGVN